MYESPLLARLFRICGWIDVAAAVIVLIAGFADNGPGNHTAAPGVLAAFGVLASALVLFGLGQVIDHIGQIAYNSNTMVKLLEAQAAAAPAAKPLPKAFVPSSRPTPAARARSARGFYYYLDQDTQTVGPVAESELQRLAAREAIGPDTLVCREGEDQWLKLDEAAPQLLTS